MAKTTKELLEELTSEASDVRSDNASVKSGLTRKGEDIEPSPEVDESEQDIETEDEPDEEPEVEEPESQEESEDEQKEKESPEDIRARNKENALRRIIQDKDKKVAEMQSKLEQFERATSEKKQQEIGEEIGELAKELQLDPDGLTKIFNKFESIVERKFQAKLPPEEIISDYEERQEQQYFDTEWRDEKVQSYIEQNYPRANARQLEEAKALLDEIAHSEDGGRIIKDDKGQERLAGYPLEYLMWQNKEMFDSILSSKKRHGLESANRSSIDETEEEIDTSSARGVDALDKKYSKLSQGDSGLHRVRPSSRSI